MRSAKLNQIISQLAFRISKLNQIISHLALRTPHLQDFKFRQAYKLLHPVGNFLLGQVF